VTAFVVYNLLSKIQSFMPIPNNNCNNLTFNCNCSRFFTNLKTPPSLIWHRLLTEMDNLRSEVMYSKKPGEYVALFLRQLCGET